MWNSVPSDTDPQDGYYVLVERSVDPAVLDDFEDAPSLHWYHDHAQCSSRGCWNQGRGLWPRLGTYRGTR